MITFAVHPILSRARSSSPGVFDYSSPPFDSFLAFIVSVKSLSKGDLDGGFFFFISSTSVRPPPIKDSSTFKKPRRSASL